MWSGWFRLRDLSNMTGPMTINRYVCSRVQFGTATMRVCWTIAVFLASVAGVPSSALAQAIAGVVRDSSDAPLQGVTVQAGSVALIEKSRTALTDGSGQYRLADLRPGVYTIADNGIGFNVDHIRTKGLGS